MRKFFVLAVLLFACSPTNAASLVTSVPMVEKGTATYFVNAKVGSEPIDLLVDTGAGYATLNRNLITKLRFDGQAKLIGEIEGILANGDVLVLPVYEIASFQIGACTFENIEVAETPPNARNLLGLSVLKRAAPFTLSFEPNPQLVMNNCIGQYAANHKTAGSSTIDISTSESTGIIRN